MKVCSRCGSTYSDESLTFCITDGTLLTGSYDPDATLLASSKSPNFASLPVQPLHNFSVPTATTSQNNPATYIIIALLALIVGGGLVALVMFSRTGNSQPAAQLPLNSTSSGNNQKRQPDIPKQDLPATQSQSVTQTLAPLTVNDVQNLLSRWEGAQDKQNFAAYQSCYNNPFEGVKRTTKGSLQVYNYGRWMADRRKMFANAVGMNVDLINPNIQVNGETATVEFEQFYYSVRYSDRGPKVLKIGQTINGPKIVYEELKEVSPLVE